MASDDAPLNRLIDCLNVLLGERKDSLEGREIILHLQSLISLYNNLKLSKEHFKEKELLLSKGIIRMPKPEQFYTGTHHGYRSIEEITSEIDKTEKHEKGSDGRVVLELELVYAHAWRVPARRRPGPETSAPVQFVPRNRFSSG